MGGPLSPEVAHHCGERQLRSYYEERQGDRRRVLEPPAAPQEICTSNAGAKAFLLTPHPPRLTPRPCPHPPQHRSPSFFHPLWPSLLYLPQPSLEFGSRNLSEPWSQALDLREGVSPSEPLSSSVNCVCGGTEVPRACRRLTRAQRIF